MRKSFLHVTLSFIQIGAAFVYLVLSFGLDVGSWVGSLRDFYFLFQLGAGASMLVMSLGVSRKPSPFAIYIAIYLVVSSLFLLFLAFSFFPGNSLGHTEIMVRQMFLASITGAASTWVFFLRFLRGRKMPPRTAV